MTSPDTEVFPSVSRYLARLPDGAESYPECRCKGSVVRSTLAELPALSTAVLGTLPPAVQNLITAPPDVSAWTPTVHHNALLAALFDVRYAIGGTAAFERAAFEKSRKLLGGPLYRMLFAVLRVERLLHNSERRWGMFHRGSTLTLEAYEENAGGRCSKTVLRYPPELFFDIPLRSIGQALRAAVAASGAKDSVLRYESTSPTTTAFEIRWNE
jgi:hypothetical protein